jgi:hypothetical protein
MCDFIGHDIRERNRIKSKYLEEQEWEAEPELERVEEDEQQTIPVTQ